MLYDSTTRIRHEKGSERIGERRKDTSRLSNSDIFVMSALNSLESSLVPQKKALSFCSLGLAAQPSQWMAFPLPRVLLDLSALLTW